MLRSVELPVVKQFSERRAEHRGGGVVWWQDVVHILQNMHTTKVKTADKAELDEWHRGSIPHRVQLMDEVVLQKPHHLRQELTLLLL
jgi:hypothetical protein